MLIAELNVKFHLFQKLTDLFIVVIVLDKTNHKIPEVTDIQEMTENLDIQEMTEVHVPETTEKKCAKIILDRVDQKMTDS